MCERAGRGVTNVVAEECRRALHPSLLSFSFNLENSYQLRFPKRSLPLLFFRLFAVRENRSTGFAKEEKGGISIEREFYRGSDYD